MSSNTEIIVSDNVFEIIRSEGWGYVQNYCYYDKDILKLETHTTPALLEGGYCTKNINLLLKVV